MFSGGEDYVDPWHPFAETSAQVSDILRDGGFDVNVVTRVEELERTLLSSDLLVVNAGGGQREHPLDERLLSVIAAHGGGVVALHVAATLLPAGDFWEERLGGRWVRGQTMHPARGGMKLELDSQVKGGALPVVINTVDEAYSWLRVSPDVDVLYRQVHDEVSHPVVWTHLSNGARSAYCALGHDVEAYVSPAIRQLILYLARWASESPTLS